MIEVRSVSKRYAKQIVLDGVSFTMQKGEVIALLGPNGAGKSTLMQILSNVVAPDLGTIFWNNSPYTTYGISIQQHIGFLPEHNPLPKTMYVKEYLRFIQAVYKQPKNVVEKVISQTGLRREASKKIGQLSKGYRQRVGIANALLHDPEVLILDEPTTGLDPNQLIEIRDLITKLGKSKTVLLSTHIMQEVEAICDRVIIINKGQIVLDKNLKELTEGKQQIVEVEFDYRIETVALEKLPKVAKVENPAGFVYHIYFSTQEDMRSKVFDFAHDNGLKILQLHQKNTTLEKLFVELTK